jgi:thymidylate kinase
MQDSRFAIPAVEAGLNDLRSRCVAATFSYQVLKAVEEAESQNPRLTQKEKQKIIDKTRRRIMQHEGTQLQLEYAPDLLIIPTINDPQEVIKRIKGRAATQKDDKVEFENLQFQTKLKPYFEDPWLKNLFEKHGSKVVYIDAGISPESTRQQAVKEYVDLLKERGLPYK